MPPLSNAVAGCRFGSRVSAGAFQALIGAPAYFDDGRNEEEMKERVNTHRDSFDDAQASSKSADRTFSGILQEIVNHLTEIIRSELRLARTEVRQDVTQVAKAGVFFMIGAVFGLYTLGLILLAAVYGLGTVMAPWLSALIVGAAAGLAAVIFFQIGRRKISLTSLKPDETIQSLQENVTWMKKQTK
jgi:uncharacterized membrane protein YqjE